jgi:hypothetical protein
MLEQRVKRFLLEFGVPVTEFCRRIDLSTSCYYEWRRGDLKLSDTTLKRIENYLTKYGF